MSKIEWTDETWNPVTGCTRVSAGCKNCYAERMARRLAGRCGYLEAPNHFDVTLHPDRLSQPFHWIKPRRIFVCSMGDLFHPAISAEYIVDLYETMTFLKRHTFIVLTKRPERIASVLYGQEGNWYLGGGDYIPNIWLGVTAENQQAADERIPLLLQIPGAVRFVSVEPMLGRVDIESYLWAVGASTAGPWRFPSGRVVHTGGIGGQMISSTPASELHWVICGAESGSGARPMDEDWVRSLRDQCVSADVPFFYKQRIDGGKKISMPELDGEVWDQMPMGR